MAFSLKEEEKKKKNFPSSTATNKDASRRRHACAGGNAESPIWILPDGQTLYFHFTPSYLSNPHQFPPTSDGPTAKSSRHER